mgnify:CR=1 FL=1
MMFEKRNLGTSARPQGRAAPVPPPSNRRFASGKTGRALLAPPAGPGATLRISNLLEA